MTTRSVVIRQGVLSKNDALAAGLRERFSAAGVFVVNLLSSPGAGKTALLERALRELRARGLRVAALVGDPATDCDARRLARSGAAVRQIDTHGRCHLDAEMVGAELRAFDLAGLDYLFIENVGNLVCPASYDLGQHLRVVLLAVTEGEDKPLKYPATFNSADLVLITKRDLAAACRFERAATHANVRALRPDVELLETSALDGSGLAEFYALLEARRVAALAVNAS